MEVFPALISNDDDANLLVDSAKGAMAFLVADFGFSTEITGETSRTVLAYMLPTLFFEIELDWRENSAFLLVGLMQDGRRPDGYYVDSAGRKVRWHLATVLSECREDPTLNEAFVSIRSVANGSGAAAMTKQIEVFAKCLRVVVVDLSLVRNQLARSSQ